MEVVPYAIATWEGVALVSAMASAEPTDLEHRSRRGRMDQTPFIARALSSPTIAASASPSSSTAPSALSIASTLTSSRMISKPLVFSPHRSPCQRHQF